MQILPLNSASDGFLVTKLCPSSNAVMLLKCKRASKNSFHSPYHNILASFCFYFTLLCLKFDGWCGNIQIYTGLKTQPAFSTLFSHILQCFRQTNKVTFYNVCYIISDTLIILNSYSIFIHLHISFKITVESMQHFKRHDRKT